jgi:PAS domain-containing protein
MTPAANRWRQPAPKQRKALMMDRTAPHADAAHPAAVPELAHLKAILSRSPFGVVIIGRDRTIRWANTYAATLAGMAGPDDLRGKPCGRYLCTAE